MQIKTRSRAINNEGGAMVFVALLVISTSVLSLVLLSSIKGNQSESRGSRENLNAFYVCEAAVSAAVLDLTNGGTGNLGSEDQPIALGSSEYWVQATDPLNNPKLGPGMTSLLATGGDQHSSLSAEVIVQRVLVSMYEWGAFGDEQMHMDSNADMPPESGSINNVRISDPGGQEWQGNDTRPSRSYTSCVRRR